MDKPKKYRGSNVTSNQDTKSCFGTEYRSIPEARHHYRKNFYENKHTGIRVHSGLLQYVVENHLERPFAYYIALKSLFRNSAVYLTNYEEIAYRAFGCKEAWRKNVKKLIDLGWVEMRTGKNGNKILFLTKMPKIYMDLAREKKVNLNFNYRSYVKKIMFPYDPFKSIGQMVKYIVAENLKRKVLRKRDFIRRKASYRHHKSFYRAAVKLNEGVNKAETRYQESLRYFNAQSAILEKAFSNGLKCEMLHGGRVLISDKYVGKLHNRSKTTGWRLKKSLQLITEGEISFRRNEWVIMKNISENDFYRLKKENVLRGYVWLDKKGNVWRRFSDEVNFRGEYTTKPWIISDMIGFQVDFDPKRLGIKPKKEFTSVEEMKQNKQYILEKWDIVEERKLEEKGVVLDITWALLS